MKRITKQKFIIANILLLLSSITMATPLFTPNSQPTGWLSVPDITFFDVSSGTESFYQLDYRKDTWAGNVLAKDINSVATVHLSTGPWDNLDPTLATAASLLNSTNYSNRKIATLNKAFRWNNLTGTEQADIGSEEVLNYIRGDRANEEPSGLSLRLRESVLGDILHSPIRYWNNGTHQALYVGSNDGMLHAFDATTGIENYAYIPSMLIPNLNKLTAKPYVHTHFVDGPISIAKMNISTSPYVDKTILVSGLGAGGKGLFALDVTSATAANEAEVASKVLWEIEATGSFSDLGYTYGSPQLTRVMDGVISKPAVIIGNGYMSTSGVAVLYIINANTGALIDEISTNSGTAASPNGLSTPALYDSDSDGIPEFAYAGDIDGNLWKFDLSNSTASLVMTTSPAQAITSSPVVRPHIYGGQLIAFVTGRILTTGDETDVSTHYAYGVWDGAPAANDAFQTQTLTASTFGVIRVRTVTNNPLDWTAGAGHHKGWKVALPAGERVVGEKPFYSQGRFYFLSTNPTTEFGENWIHELVFNTGGPALIDPIFDLSEDGKFDSSDFAANGEIPMAKYLGRGVFSQPHLVKGDGLISTLFSYHPDLPVIEGIPTPPEDPGVSGGHFDFDIYYYDPGSISATPTNVSETKTVCEDGKKAQKQYNGISADICTANFSAGYDFLSDYIVSAQKCGGGKKDTYIDATCNTFTTGAAAAGDYKNKKHEHEYDDKYDVTGVNMLNASLVDFNLVNAIPDTTTQFKVLVMNQYLNPAAKLSVGGADYENVKTYANLASETDATTLLNSLTTYTRANVSTLIFNLPLDAFKSKDWWEDGSAARAGLIPTQTGCVNKVNTDGSMKNNVKDAGTDKEKWEGKIGPNGERFNGALTIQLIKPTTPSSSIELNGPDVTYGWRVKQADFATYVLAEYTSFWHHPNHYCYGDADWVADAPEDPISDAQSKVAAAGSADPKDGLFTGGFAIVTDITTVSPDGLVTTQTITYSDGLQYIRIDTVNDNQTTTTYQKYRDGSEETVTSGGGDGSSGDDGGQAGSISHDQGQEGEGEVTDGGSSAEQPGDRITGRQTWQEVIN
jgi:PilC-like protein with beta-propeller domain